MCSPGVGGILGGSVCDQCPGDSVLGQSKLQCSFSDNRRKFLLGLLVKMVKHSPCREGWELEVWRDTKVTRKEIFLIKYHKLCSASWLSRSGLTPPVSIHGDNASICCRLTQKHLNKVQHCTASSHLCKTSSRLCWARQRLPLSSCPVRLQAPYTREGTVVRVQLTGIIFASYDVQLCWPSWNHKHSISEASLKTTDLICSVPEPSMKLLKVPPP